LGQGLGRRGEAGRALAQFIAQTVDLAGNAIKLALEFRFHIVRVGRVGDQFADISDNGIELRGLCIIEGVRRETCNNLIELVSVTANKQGGFVVSRADRQLGLDGRKHLLDLGNLTQLIGRIGEKGTARSP
jgi:hypothetical protein